MGGLECHPKEFEPFHPGDSRKALKALSSKRVNQMVVGKVSEGQEQSESQGT